MRIHYFPQFSGEKRDFLIICTLTTVGSPGDLNIKHDLEELSSLHVYDSLWC